ncbi:hypothetical protein M2138_001144 [Dysgonomonadaceae bacterium PH5-43]|nr:hypothetical protein [Dysgonomonadaceae bacterium PH5-43]
MKTKHILLLLALFYVFNANGQLKHFLPRENAQMYVLDMRFSFDGDTIINNKRYTKVYYEYASYDKQTNTVGDYYSYEYFAAVREDTINQKIYTIYSDDLYNDRKDREHLLADFDLKVGDKMPEVMGIDGVPDRELFVTKIDSVEIQGSLRKRICFKENRWVPEDDYWNFDRPIEYWIEGIGSNYSLFFPAALQIIDGREFPILSCFYVNGELIYENPYYTEMNGVLFGVENKCYHYSGFGVAIINIKESNISLSPTYVDSYIQIEGNKNNCLYSIVDMNGSVVKKGNVENEIDVVDLPSGAYGLTLYDKGQQIYRGKFIKK